MRLSRAFVPTLKETPKEAEIVSHQLMLRAPGVYIGPGLMATDIPDLILRVLRES